jgi:uncharacterized FlaG/YvyC family protein
MDTGLTIRPSDGGGAAAVVRPTPAPVPQAVATDLASARAVTATESTSAVRNDTGQAASQQPATRVDITFDKKTHTAVYQIVDSQTGQVILQVPQQARADITV